MMDGVMVVTDDERRNEVDEMKPEDFSRDCMID